MSESNRFGIVVHGGASANPSPYEETTSVLNFSISKIVSAGYKMIEKGATALDTVEAVIKKLEDDPLYNAGTGCCLTSEGTVELEAMIMDGNDMTLGSVACVDFTSHPISLARLVMEASPHCMMVGSGAKRFAESNSFEIVESSSLSTDSATQNITKYNSCLSSTSNIMNAPTTKASSDTVGAVVLDCYGHLACGTSTGGINSKLPGRVGDSPLIGCGAYANSFGAATATGHGETIMKSLCSYKVVNEIENSLKPSDSAKSALENAFKNSGHCGGVICMNSRGDVGVYHSSEFMVWASYTNTAGFDSFYKNITEQKNSE